MGKKYRATSGRGVCLSSPSFARRLWKIFSSAVSVRREKLCISRRWLCLGVIFAFLLCMVGEVFADFPPALVIDGSVSSGTMIAATSGSCYYKYTVTGGVLLLSGSSGGQAAWGSTEASALNAPSATGTWDGGLTVSITGHAVVVPQVVVSYPGTVSPVAMTAYNGASYTAAGTGTNAAGRFVVAYHGLSDGCIFTFGDGLPCYRYQAGSKPVVINTGSNGWPPSNLYAFPSQLYINGEKVASASFTEGISNGYWCNEYYVGASGYANFHIYISPDATTGILWGSVGNQTISATWDPACEYFTADAGTGVSLVPSDQPQCGLPQIEWDGVIIPFKFRDNNGSDVYSASGTQIIIDSNGNVTATKPYSTVTGWWGYGRHWTGGAFFWFGDGESQGVNMAAVSADGMSFYELIRGYAVYTSGWDPGSIMWAYYSSQNNDDITWEQPYVYSFRRSDGTMAYFYPRPVYYDGYWLKLCDITYLCWDGDGVIDATAGLPPSDIYNLQCPSAFWLDGTEYNASSGGGTDGVSFIFNAFYNSSEGHQIIMWGGFSLNWATGKTSLEFTLADDGWLNEEPYFGSLSFSSWNGYSSDGSHYLTVSPSSPKYGPPQITWNGEVLTFSCNTTGADVYEHGTGAHVTISGSTVTVTGTHSVLGIYNPATYQFDFGNDQAMQGFLAQNADGDLLGKPAGIVVNVNNYNTWNPAPEGWRDGSAQYIVLGDGTTYRYSYDYARNQNTIGVKFLNIPQDSLFRIADSNGNFISPVYRYSASGTNDFVVNASHDYMDPNSYYWDSSNLYPPQLYVNGHYTVLDASSLSDSRDSQGNCSGAVNYHVQPTGETISIAWTWYGSFNAVVTGSYDSFSNISGKWDGYKLFAQLPSGLVISLYPPTTAVRYGPTQVEWNGVVLTFNSVASSVSGSNPQGDDVYTDANGSSIKAVVGSNGSVVLYAADGTQYAGTYSASTGVFTITGQPEGAVVALNSSGSPAHRQSTSATGTAGGVSSFLGSVDIQGDYLTLGSWKDNSGYSVEGLSISFADVQNPQTTFIRFAAVRNSTTWIWSHADSDGSGAQDAIMQLDISNRLQLFDPGAQTGGTTAQPTIILDPAASGTSQFKGAVLIAPQGDLDMGQFKTGSAPQ